MKNKSKTFLIIIIALLVLITSGMVIIKTKNNKSIQNNNNQIQTASEIEIIENPIVFDGLTMEELSAKLDRVLNSTLSGYGSLFAEKSIELGLDPYLAVAITLLETGCKWNCSYLLKKCNNVAGIKGKPGCDGGSYKKFDTLEDGINYYLKMLYNNYYAKGLTTPELINPKYAESKDWARQVNKYIEEIKKV